MNPFGRTFKTRKGAENLVKREERWAWETFGARLVVVETADGFIVNWINPVKEA